MSGELTERKKRIMRLFVKKVMDQIRPRLRELFKARYSEIEK